MENAPHYMEKYWEEHIANTELALAVGRRALFSIYTRDQLAFDFEGSDE